MKKNTSTTLLGHWVKLTLPEVKDYPLLKKILNDKETMESLIPFFGRSEWTENQVRERNEKFRQAYLQGKGIDWTVYSLNDALIVGNCGFKNIDKIRSEAEFGIILHKVVWGKGHAIECHLLSLKYAFEILKLRRIYFNTDDHNKRMKGFFDKVGIRFVKKTSEGHLQYEIQATEWVVISSRLNEHLNSLKY